MNESLCLTDATENTRWIVFYGIDNREIVRIGPNGEVTVNPEFPLDEAARLWWECVERNLRPKKL